MIARVRQWWIGLSRRERIATSVAAALVIVSALYLAAIEPAWRAQQRLGAELPRLRAELAELEALAIEAIKLRKSTLPRESPAQAKAALAKLLAGKKIPNPGIRDGDEQRMLVSLRRADAASVLAWLEEASTELPLRISSARIARVAPGLVDADMTLDLAEER